MNREIEYLKNFSVLSLKLKSLDKQKELLMLKYKCTQAEYKLKNLRLDGEIKSVKENLELMIKQRQNRVNQVTVENNLDKQ